MIEKILLDANVMLDFLLLRHKSAEQTSRIIQKVESGSFEGYLTVSIIQIIAYWITKEWGHQNAKTGLLSLLNSFEVADGNKQVVLTALSSKFSDIEDSLQYYTGVYHEIDAIVSRDKLFRKSAFPVLPVFTPDEFVKKYMGN